jgi:hypothetical protein
MKGGTESELLLENVTDDVVICQRSGSISPEETPCDPEGFKPNMRVDWYRGWEPLSSTMAGFHFRINTQFAKQITA